MSPTTWSRHEAAHAPVAAIRAFDRMWADLEPVGRASSGGYRRYAWTREDHDLREWFAGEAAARGLDLVEDRAGNQWAWWGNHDAQGRDGSPGVVVGSHLDSVPDGGAFDGPLGVVSALAAVDALRSLGLTPQVPLAVASFGDEEGARFGIACAGSRILTGALPAHRALALRDNDGITMAEALKAAGRNPDTLGADSETHSRVGHFVELHVEQGRALSDPERYDQATSAVAVGTDIWPHGRWRVELPGVANHAGTTRLQDRSDAMLSLAAVVVAAREAAVRRACVATVGKVRVEPNGVNAIPSLAVAWLDARGPDEEQVRMLVEDVRGAVVRTGGVVHEESWTATTRFSAELTQRVRDILGPAPALGTGAGHDAGILASHGISATMMFVRNPTGVSHSPLEHAEPDDCHAGVSALTEVVADLTGAVPSGGTRDAGQQGAS